MIGLDTNVLLRWLLTSDEMPSEPLAQVRAVERAVLERAKGCYANAVVVAETMWVVGNRMKQSRDTQAQVVERLLLSHDVRVSDRKAVIDALASFREGGGGFVDHLIGAMNRIAGCSTTLTFDRSASKSPDFTELNP